MARGPTGEAVTALGDDLAALVARAYRRGETPEQLVDAFVDTAFGISVAAAGAPAGMCAHAVCQHAPAECVRGFERYVRARVLSLVEELALAHDVDRDDGDDGD